MSKELVFNVGNIFNSTSPEGALYQYEVEKYFIAPYQRGYKWAAIGPNDAVCLLMKDLFDASQNGAGEYYLQFITTKKSSINDHNVLEVIDGQQRLTTLTVLLSVLSQMLSIADTPSNNLLSYEVRPKVTDFFREYIYGDISELLSRSWQDFIKFRIDMDEQDIFYLFSAANKIKEMVAANYEDNLEGIAEFRMYVLEKVMIILNNIDRNVSCEELFGNLNDNKVELSSAELIKGLLLTNSAREKASQGKTRVHYKELLEIRAVMGRQWDDINIWVNKKEIKNFFFNNQAESLDELLQLLAINDGYKENSLADAQTEIFNYIQGNVRKDKKSTAEYFEELKNLRYIFNEWFLDNEIYNSLGYLFFSKGSKKNIRDYLHLLQSGKAEIKAILKAQVAATLPDDIESLEYGQDNNQIYNLLLALSVFADKNRFNFTEFNSRTGWSLEHIFPRNPEALPDTLGSKDLELIRALAGDRLDNFDTASEWFLELDEDLDLEHTYTSLQTKINAGQGHLSQSEKLMLYSILKSDKLNSIGNMALLQGSDNSSNSNNMFDNKRYNIARRVSIGSFVPKHTYDVFSKLISQSMTPDLKVWTENDIDTHAAWINQRIIALKN